MAKLVESWTAVQEVFGNLGSNPAMANECFSVTQMHTNKKPLFIRNNQVDNIQAFNKIIYCVVLQQG